MFTTQSRFRRLPLTVIVIAALAFAATACAAKTSGPPSSVTAVSPRQSGAFRGEQLSTPVTINAATQSAVFQESSGGTTSLSQLQSAGLMLVYFGYTSCPDICPTTMADLGQALRKLPAKIQHETQVVFVTSDPARDTAPVMQAWLEHFDDGVARPFVGLTATLTQIDTVASSLGIPLQPPVTEPDGSISVEHGAQTLAFVNDKADLMWLADTSVSDYAHDITKLSTKLTK
ncbi:protein SCO1/2 [Antricoccus suffuscus]|uniref:Protein SCO1/2 n=1 Tax=Antricoccus suffuscus TaxID=1629062 RepID=A0A2T1A631_9ACTN|nr:SCO family protein [Antricoccus suffuscus]PRZ44072.1 protein SCO1/2 [Antricoccus suffuscus]